MYKFVTPMINTSVASVQIDCNPVNIPTILLFAKLKYCNLLYGHRGKFSRNLVMFPNERLLETVLPNHIDFSSPPSLLPCYRLSCLVEIWDNSQNVALEGTSYFLVHQGMDHRERFQRGQGM
jgi:hypothetical protein